MNRRRFAAAIVTTLVAAPAIAHARFIPPREFEAEDFAAVKYRGGADDAPIRSVSARVSLWADEDAAEEHRQFIIAGAGSDLPQGEFYQSEPEEYHLPPDQVLVPVTVMGWHTTVGVAAYRTEWVVLSARLDRTVWDLWISGAEPGPVLDLAGTLAADLTLRGEPGGDLFSLLPGEDDVPEGLTLEYRMSPAGTVDSQGTPIPDPTLANEG